MYRRRVANCCCHCCCSWVVLILLLVVGVTKCEPEFLQETIWNDATIDIDASHAEAAPSPRTRRRSKLRRMRGSTDIPQQFIVIFRDSVVNVTAKIDQLFYPQSPLSIACGGVTYTYESTIKGFAVQNCATESSNQFQEVLHDDDDVLHVWTDAVVTGDNQVRQRQQRQERQDTPIHVQNSSGNSFYYWLDRLDQPSPPNDNQYRYRFDGSNVTIFVLDTGIRTTHREFVSSSDSQKANTRTDNVSIGEGRRTVQCGFNAFKDNGGGDELLCADDNGHGSFMAAVAAGFEYGVAKNADIVAVRVLDQEKRGSVAGIIAGIDYVAQQKKQNKDQPMVVSMSLYVLTATVEDCVTISRWLYRAFISNVASHLFLTWPLFL